jgi:hypothetical protein
MGTLIPEATLQKETGTLMEAGIRYQIMFHQQEAIMGSTTSEASHLGDF